MPPKAAVAAVPAKPSRGIARRTRNAHGDTIQFNTMTAHCIAEVNGDVWIGSDQRILIWCTRVCLNFSRYYYDYYFF